MDPQTRAQYAEAGKKKVRPANGSLELCRQATHVICAAR
jgi:hypothetical protein